MVDMSMFIVQKNNIKDVDVPEYSNYSTRRRDTYSAHCVKRASAAMLLTEQA